MKARRLSLGVVALLGALSVGGTGSAHAQSALVCDGAGRLTAQNGTPATWQVSGQGRCLQPGFGSQPRTLSFNGSGTSDSLGLCTPGRLAVNNLELDVTVSITRAGTGAPVVKQETWTAPVTTFPLATPFLITNGAGDPSGVGLTLHRIFLQCGDNGRKPSAVFEWVRM
jgi:hypothetical protein